MIPMDPIDEQTITNVNVNQALSDISKISLFIQSEVPNSRERSLAITKLDEAYMWLSQIMLANTTSHMS